MNVIGESARRRHVIGPVARTRSRKFFVPERRMIIVLSSLLGAMTLTSGLLLLLEPRPVAPWTDLSLRATDRIDNSEAVLFRTATPIERNRWQAIVIHDSRTSGGSARSLANLHERQGRGGLGYHFVIGNGQGAEDGLIEIGFRWERQMFGVHSGGEVGAWLNEHAISICLIGDGDSQPYTDAQLQSLLWLIHRLQRQFNIPAENVILDVTRQTGGGVGPMFPTTWLRPQLLNPAVP